MSGGTDECHPPFHLQIPGFEGSMESLQALLDRRELALTDISLAAITDQFSAHIAASGQVDLEETGDFLRVAARMLAQKSELLLPRQEETEEAPPRVLESIIGREALYAAARELGERQGQESFPPEPRWTMVERRTEPRSPHLLQRAWLDLAKRQGEAAVRVAAPAFVRLEVALSRLMRRLKSGARISLRRTLDGATRPEAVIHFLAVLELVRRRHAAATQDRLFADIEIEQVDSGVEASSRAG